MAAATSPSLFLSPQFLSFLLLPAKIPCTTSHHHGASPAPSVSFSAILGSRVSIPSGGAVAGRSLAFETRSSVDLDAISTGPTGRRSPTYRPGAASFPHGPAAQQQGRRWQTTPAAHGSAKVRHFCSVRQAAWLILVQERQIVNFQRSLPQVAA